VSGVAAMPEELEPDETAPETTEVDR